MADRLCHHFPDAKAEQFERRAGDEADDHQLTKISFEQDALLAALEPIADDLLGKCRR